MPPKMPEFIQHLRGTVELRPFISDYGPLDEPVEFAIRRFSAYHAQPNTLYLAGVHPEAVDKVAFAPISSSTQRKTRHGVFFGGISINGRRSLPVAVKTFDDDYTSWGMAMREQMVTSALKSLGVMTLRPQGLLLSERPDGQPIAYGFTKLNDGLSNFDALDWRQYYPNMKKNPGMQQMWHAIAYEAANIHRSGRISHNDFFGRNYCTTPTNLGFSMDNEYSLINPEPARDAETRYCASMSDIRDALRTVCLPPQVPNSDIVGFGIATKARVPWLQVFKEVFFDDYTTARELYIDRDPNPADQLAAREELAELTRTVATLALQMENTYRE
jgi:hypothetical protein